MKKISLLFVGVLFCTLVFANGTDEPASFIIRSSDQLYGFFIV